jgi:phosphoglycerate dehydrogenase-like enzyme
MRTAAVLLISCAAIAQPRILVSGMGPAEMEVLAAAKTGATFEAAKPGETFLQQLATADAYWGQQITAAQLRAAPKLKWMQTFSAGVEQVLAVPEFKQSSITLTNCKILQGPNIADHAFALLLGLTRGTAKAASMRASEVWDQSQFRPVELTGKTALVVGVGGIGQQIAQRAHAFGMRVIGVDPKEVAMSANIQKVVTPDRIDEVIGEADVIFISAPHTPDSEGMIGPEQFEKMKRGAYFVAVSRGKLYNMPALVKALDSRKLAGAGLDVTDPEPLPKGHPLWKFDNVVITPHIAGQSDLVGGRRNELLIENARRFAAGKPLLNVVDKQKGY